MAVTQIQPLEVLFLNRQLDAGALDTNVYYVQAKIYNASNNALLATVNLTLNPNIAQDYVGTWQVPNGGINGYYIYIITTVYTNSSYTNQSPTYSVTSDTYLVQQRFNTSIGYGGDSVIDWNSLKGIIKDELKIYHDTFPTEKGLKGKDIEEVIGNVLAPYHESILSQLSINPREHETTRKMIDGYAKQGAKLDPSVTSYFDNLVSRLGESVNQQMQAHQRNFQTATDGLHKKLVEHLEKNGSMLADNHKKNMNEMKNIIGGHFSELMSQENESRGKQMKKILLDNIRKAMNDSEFTAPSLHEKKENVVDVNAMRANNLIKKLT